MGVGDCVRHVQGDENGVTAVCHVQLGDGRCAEVSSKFKVMGRG